MLPTKTIRTKADLIDSISKLKGVKIPEEGKSHYAEMVRLLASINDKHGRSEASRDAAKKAEKARGKLVLSMKKTEQLAPKKKSGEKETKKTGETTKSPRFRSRVVYDNTPAVGGKYMCLCGCGVETTTMKRKTDNRHKLFIQGHDAKLRGKAGKVASGDLNKSVLSHYAKEFLARWDQIDAKILEGCGIDQLSPFNHKPQTWEDFDDLRSDTAP